MNSNYIRLFSILLLVTPSMFLGMQKPVYQTPFCIEEEVITPERLGHEQLHQNDRLFEESANDPEAQAGFEAFAGLLQMLNNPTPETNAFLLQLQAEAIREQARRAVRVIPSIEEVVEPPVAIVNSVRTQVLAQVPVATPNPTRTERLQAYWNSLHPAVKAGVVGIGAIATCSAAKKLYDFVNKRK